MRASPSHERVATALIDRVHFVRVVRGFVHRHGRRDLDRLERAVVEVALQLAERGNHFGVADMNAMRHPAIEKLFVIE